MTTTVLAALKRTDKTTKVVEYYVSESGEWVTDITLATHYGEEDAPATKRCMEAKDRTNRISRFTYDTFVL